MTTRIVSFLGVQTYKEVIYRFADGQESRITRFLCAALLERHPGSDVRVLVTEEAREKNGNDVLAALSQSGLSERPGNDVFAPISSSADPSDWTNFDVLVELMRDRRFECVLLDITNGFRSLPFYAGAAVNYVKAAFEDAPDIRIVYGAFDSGTMERCKDLDGVDREITVAPVWDLTPVLELGEWSFGIRSFLRTASAAEIGQIIERKGREIRKAHIDNVGTAKNAPNLDKLGRALTRFSDDLGSVRTRELLQGVNGESSASYLLRVIEMERERAKREFPPLAYVFEGLYERVGKLPAREGLAGENGRTSIVALARLYLDAGRLLEAAATIREGFLSLNWEEPGEGASSQAFKRSREASRARLEESETFRNIIDLRNDILHAGYRMDSKPPKAIKKGLEACLEDLKRESISTASTTHGADRVFANISNHPSSAWSDLQRKQALSMADSIHDIPFPVIPPEATGPDVGRILGPVVREIPPTTTHAMVMGEFTACFALVRELQAMGVMCLAATTGRCVEQEEDGVTRRRFDFAGFRPYVKLEGDS